MNDDRSFEAPDPHDPFDDELRRRFAGGSGTDGDPDVALDAMRPRLQRARTRRRASIASAIGAAAVVVVVLAFALGGGGGGGGAVHTPPATRRPLDTVSPAPTTTPSGGSTTPDALPGSEGEREDAAGVTPTVPADGANRTSTPPEISPPTQASPPDTPFSSDGGSIVVHFEHGQVSLVSSSPAPGYTAEVHDNGPSRVEVRFSNGQGEWRIRVDVADGRLVPEITQH